MKPILSAVLFLHPHRHTGSRAGLLRIAARWGLDGYNGYDRLVPPLPVPGYPVSTTQSVVTTRRDPRLASRVCRLRRPGTVVTTRRVVAPRPILEEDDLDVGSIVAFALSATGRDCGSTGLPARLCDRRP